MAKGLTEKRQRFVEEYVGPAQGNATAAARAAGYAAPETEGHRLLQIADVAAAIDAMRATVRSSAIASIEDVQSVLTSILQDETMEPKDRISAGDKLLKCQGAYLERRHVTGDVAVQRVRLALPDNGRGPATDE